MPMALVIRGSDRLAAGSVLVLEIDKIYRLQTEQLRIDEEVEEFDATSRSQVALYTTRSALLIGYGSKHRR